MRKILLFLILIFSFSSALTYADTRVNAAWWLDSDYDGVPDSVDKCPNTPAVEAHLVDAGWCAIDTKQTYANPTGWSNEVGDNIKTGWANNQNWVVNNLMTNFKWDEFFWASQWWEQGIFYFIVRIAKDLKDLFFVIVSVYLIISVLMIFFAANTEEQIWKFKKAIVWSTVWIMVMQTAYAFTKSLYDKWVSQYAATNFIADIVYPLIHLLEQLAAFFFLAVAIYSFFRLVTANWAEDKIKLWKNTIIQAIIWFIVIKISGVVVSNIYGHVNCDSLNQNCLINGNTEWTLWVAISLINWLNAFIWILVVIMTIYAGSKIMLSWWNEEDVKKWKAIIKYIFIWLLLLATSYLILTFFIIPESKI